MSTTRRRIALAVAAVLALAGLGFSGVLGDLFGTEKTSGGTTVVWSPTPRASTSAVRTPTPAASSVKSSVKASASRKPAPQGCGPQGAIKPTTFTIDSMDVTSRVLSLGTDRETGAAAAPPKDQPTTVGWFNEGPKPGSDKGKVLLTIHTYRNGGALGNEMNSDQGLEPGDIMRLSDSSGKTVCYRYRESLKVMIKDYYDAPADILYDNTGDPEVAIIICWDFNKTTKLWDSRIIYYADPIEG